MLSTSWVVPPKIGEFVELRSYGWMHFLTLTLTAVEPVRIFVLNIMNLIGIIYLTLFRQKVANKLINITANQIVFTDDSELKT